MGLTLLKSRRRDPDAIDYGCYALVAIDTGGTIHPEGVNSIFSISDLDEVEDWLNHMRERQGIRNYYGHIFICASDDKEVPPPPISRGPVQMVEITCRTCGNNVPIKLQTLQNYGPETIQGIIGNTFEVIERYCD